MSNTIWRCRCGYANPPYFPVCAQCPITPSATSREIVAKIRHDAAALDDASFVRAFQVIPERIEQVVDALERELNIAAQHAVLQAEEIASLKDKVTAAWTAGRESADGGFYDGVEAAAAYMAAHSATSPKQLRELIARKAWGQRDTAYARGWTAGRDAAGEKRLSASDALVYARSLVLGWLDETFQPDSPVTPEQAGALIEEIALALRDHGDTCPWALYGSPAICGCPPEPPRKPPPESAPAYRAVLDESCERCKEVRRFFRDGVCNDHLVREPPPEAAP